MNTIVFVAMLVAVAFAAPQAPTEPIPILKYDSQINGDGSDQYAYDTGNGIAADEKGELRVGDVDAISVQDKYNYPGENGETISLTYTADENGFPPEPEAILTSLAYLATAPPPAAQ